MKIYLNKPAILTALGEGIEQHVAQLLQGSAPAIQCQNKLYTSRNISGKAQYLAGIDCPLRAFPEGLDAKHRSRNNQLLWHALAQIEDQIQLAIQQFGTARIAVVMGTSTTGVDENIPFLQSLFLNQPSEMEFNYEQQYFNAPADFIAEQYQLKNVAYGISTACTSGARAIMSAARLLRANFCDAVICGGVDCLSPLTVSGFGSLSVLNKGQTQAFSQSRAGINIGEGVGVFVMTREPLADCVEYLGGGASSDAYHMSSPDPTGTGAKNAFLQALNQAQCSSETIGWINAHGTGTQHNDAMESIAIAEVFGTETPVTSTKPYTGHTLGAAGAVEAALSWGMIHRHYNPNGQLPPQFWDKHHDENLPHIKITDENSHWQQGKRIVASSSFAFGGNNAVLILGEKE